MINIVEFTLPRPTPFSRRFQLEPHLPGATVRIFEPGERDDITSSLWNNQTHQWLLNVRRDGVGVLRIKPVSRNASVLASRRGARLERLKEVTYTLERPSRHLLIGSQLADAASGHIATVFKAVCALEDSDRLMQWIRDSGPRRITWR